MIGNKGGRIGSGEQEIQTRWNDKRFPQRKSMLDTLTEKREERGSHNRMAFCFPLYFFHHVCHSRKEKTICTSPPSLFPHLHIYPISLLKALFIFLFFLSPLPCQCSCCPDLSVCSPQSTGQVNRLGSHPLPFITCGLVAAVKVRWWLLLPLWPQLPTLDS